MFFGQNRRGFLASLLASPLFLSQARQAKVQPMMVSTWDNGIKANAAGWKVLEKGGNSLDAAEQAAREIEATLDCCVGLQANPDRDGKVTLDASIMDGDLRCGSVAFIERILHPISVARKVMENTPHVLLAGEGAQQFARENGFPVEADRLSPDAEKRYRDWLRDSKYKPIINIENRKQSSSLGPASPLRLKDGTPNHDTMGVLSMDARGRVAGACTTSGMAFKVRGRVGDSPIIGAGLYADNEAGAATSSGVGEEVIRICGTHLVVEFMRQGKSPEAACKAACERIVRRSRGGAKDLQVGFLAISVKGEIGAYSIQKGFTYAVTHGGQPEGKIYTAPSIY